MSALNATSAITSKRKPLAAARSRLLGREHFAFFRGLLEGLPLYAIWDRYLSVEGQHTDVRLAPATVAWIREELSAIARRQAKPGTARLLRLDAQQLVIDGPALPTLAQFAEEAGLEDEREVDQIEAFEARYGRATSRVARRSRLLRRQLAALRWLEEIAARDPVAGDAVSSWLRPELAAFLVQADVFTLQQLAQRINGLGKSWARGIRGIGPLKAERIARWVAAHAGTIGEPIGDHVWRPRRAVSQRELLAMVPPAADVRPLEKLVVPEALSGRAGRFRQPQDQCLMQADNDYDAVLTWLSSKRPDGGAPHQALDLRAPDEPSQPPSHTQRSYRKEAERLLLWAIVHRGKALSSLTAEDCIAYAAFLADPQPRSRWCGPRARGRWSPLWRPFEGPLSPAAQRLAVTVLNGLFTFLVEQNYLRGNPWSAVPVPRSVKPGLDVSRSLTTAQWDLVRDRAHSAGTHSTAIRLRLALDLLYATGVRTCEAVQAKVGDLKRVDYFDAEAGERVQGWMLSVVGKGRRLREVPVPDTLVQDLRCYLRHRGLSDDLDAPEVRGAHMLGAAVDLDRRAGALARSLSVDARQGISESALYNQIKAHFADCASAATQAGDLRSAERLVRASTHWLRHSHASHALASGMRVQEAQQNLGHASLATTTAYVTTEQAQRLRSMQKFWRAGSGG